MNFTLPEPMRDLREKSEMLLGKIRDAGRAVVAFSGGVDSCVVARAAVLALGKEDCVAATAVSPSLATRELDAANRTAAEIGIPLQLLKTAEVADPRYQANDGKRCYFCKSELYRVLFSFCQEHGFQVILNGTNTDDHSDYRPGLQAADEFNVHSPLAECGFDKQDVRQLANQWQLSTWDKPASPCLASRVAHFETVDPAKLKMIELAEDFLIESGFNQVRVRLHADRMARVEVPVDDLSKLCQPDFRQQLVRRFREIGFDWITLDLEGFRSGSLNTMLPLVKLGSV